MLPDVPDTSSSQDAVTGKRKYQDSDLLPVYQAVRPSCYRRLHHDTYLGSSHVVYQLPQSQEEMQLHPAVRDLRPIGENIGMCLSAR